MLRSAKSSGSSGAFQKSLRQARLTASLSWRQSSKHSQEKRTYDMLQQRFRQAVEYDTDGDDS